MASDNVRERKENRHFTVVLISGTDSSHTRTFSASLWKLIGFLVSALAVLTALITAVIVYTPVGSRLPISNSKLETEYGTQIQEIRERMGVLFTQLNTLRSYNVRLRRALGEQITDADTGMIPADTPDTVYAGSAAPPGDFAEGTSSAGPGGMAFEPAGAADEGIGTPGTVLMVTGQGGDGSGMVPETFPLSAPTTGFLTREFAPDEFHFGVDFAAKEGTAVTAAAPGYVIFAGWTTVEGNMIMISHPGGYVTVYKHNKSLLKSVGDAVRRGELVAQVGNTGRSTAPHLHFEVWKDGIAQNAGNYLLTTQ